MRVKKTPLLSFKEFEIAKTTRESVFLNTHKYLNRYCELELLQSGWKHISKLAEHLKTSSKKYDSKITEIIVNKTKSRFSPFFDIKRILFNDIGFLIFKIILEAEETGVMHPDIIGLKIEVKPKNHIVVNEVKKNSLLYENCDKLEMKLGDTLVYYISHSK